MRALRKPPLLTLLGIAVALLSPVFAANRTVPDERDRQVLEAVLLRLVDDAEFAVPRVTTDRPVIVLHTRTPEKIGFLMPAQIRSDIGRRTLPSDAEEDLRRRNTPLEKKPDTFDAVAASFTNLAFSARILVADMPDRIENQTDGAFKEAHPNVRGFARAYLPGYSKDGTRAVVRASVGPSPHGAMLTALLKKVGEKWVVKWHRIALYV